MQKICNIIWHFDIFSINLRALIFHSPTIENILRMKKLFLLSIISFLTCIGASADAVTYKSIGTGLMTDDMITGLIDCQPVTYAVEIEQAEDGSDHYRVLAPYGKSFADAMEKTNNKVLTPEQYDAEGKCFIEIDATNHDDVIFHKTMTGCDLGSGEMFIGINTQYCVTLKDGKFTAPMMGIAVGSGNSAVAGNRRGKFRIVLPGVEPDDFDITLTPESQCLTERTFKASISVGADVETVRYHVMPNWQEDEIMSAVKEIAAKGALFTPRGEFSYEMEDEINKETIVVVALDADGNNVGYDWCTYYFIDENPDGWTDCGMAEYTDGMLQDMISNIPSQTTRCMMQQSKDNPDRYRLVNPYSGLAEYAALNKGHEDHNHFIYIDAADPECIYVEESPIGMESSQYGLMRISSYVQYFLDCGSDLEECKELELGAIIDNGVMTFPEEAMIFSMMKYDNGDWWTTNSEGLTSIKLPEGFNFAAGVEGITADDSDAPVEYYNLQGMRVANPAAGQVYIRRAGPKVTKEIAR